MVDDFAYEQDRYLRSLSKQSRTAEQRFETALRRCHRHRVILLATNAVLLVVSIAMAVLTARLYNVI